MGQAIPCLPETSDQQHAPVVAISVGVLQQQHADELQTQLYGHPGVVVAEAMAGAAVLRVDLRDGEAGHGGGSAQVRS